MRDMCVLDFCLFSASSPPPMREQPVREVACRTCLPLVLDCRRSHLREGSAPNPRLLCTLNGGEKSGYIYGIKRGYVLLLFFFFLARNTCRWLLSYAKQMMLLPLKRTPCKLPSWTVPVHTFWIYSEEGTSNHSALRFDTVYLRQVGHGPHMNT